MTDLVVLQARLTEVEDALHKVLMGESEVEVEYDGYRQKFTRTDEVKLRRYISSLKRELGVSTKPMSRRVLM